MKVGFGPAEVVGELFAVFADVRRRLGGGAVGVAATDVASPA